MCLEKNYLTVKDSKKFITVSPLKVKIHQLTMHLPYAN